ncbi:MAG: hypothetical protein LBC86_06115 [Oscillospiraceae bacterium]|nr:hypothetical protein [Oscillospiraceae bacterium]
MECKETYATATRPDTRWAVVEFYVSPTRTSNPNTGFNNKFKNVSGSVAANPCTFYTSDSVANAPWACSVVLNNVGRLNATSDTYLCP